MEPGERWAYRAAPDHGAVSEVEVLKVGTQRPRRVKVSFTADEAEGREEWVSPARLRVRWEDKDAWLETQRRWSELTRDAPDDEDTDFVAVSLLFEEHLLDGVVAIGWNTRDRGVLFIDDVAALAAVLGVQETFFLTDPRALTDTAGAVTAPWPVTLAVARLLARVRADTVLPVLAEQDRRARQRAVYGEYYRGRGKNPGTYISAETCAEVDRTYSQGRDLLRQWCGAEAVEARAELEALRLEVVRIGKLTEEAIRLLRDGGQGKAAERLERQLGVPLELLRRAPAQTD